MDLRNYSQDFLAEFISLYESYPCLWKVKSKEYSNRNAKNVAYDALVSKLKEVVPDADRDTVVKKINSLRTCYRKELKKVNSSMKSGAVEDEIYKPHLWYFDLLTFLNGQEIPRKFHSLPGDEYTDNNKDSQSEADPLLIVPQKEDFDLSASCSVDYFQSSTSSSTSECKQVYESDIIAPECKYESDTIIRLIGNRLLSAKSEDRCDYIGKIWADNLRKLTNEQQIYAEKIINDVFYEARCGNLKRNSHCLVIDKTRDS